MQGGCSLYARPLGDVVTLCSAAEQTRDTRDTRDTRPESSVACKGDGTTVNEKICAAPKGRPRMSVTCSSADINQPDIDTTLPPTVTVHADFSAYYRQQVIIPTR
jgi:hypothetical protein